MSLLEDYLSDAIRYQGVDGESTGCANDFLGGFHYIIVGTLSCNNEKKNISNSLRLTTKKHHEYLSNTMVQIILTLCKSHQSYHMSQAYLNR
jgi:hypothetical protein